MARPLIAFSFHRSPTRWIRWYLVLSLTWGPLWLIGVEPTSRVYAQPPASDPTLAQASLLLETEQREEAISLLRRFLATPPDPSLLAETYLLLGTALYDTQEYGEALKYLQQLQREFPNTPRGNRNQLLQARVHGAMGNLDLALLILTNLRALSSEQDVKRDALHLSGEFYAEKNDIVRAIQAWVDALPLDTEEQSKEVRTRIHESITNTSDRKALERIRKTFLRNFPGDLAALRLIDLSLARGEEPQAIRQIQQFLSGFPTHPQTAKILERFATLQAKLKTYQFFLATVLPLSGKLAPFADETLNGIELAIDVYKEQTGVPSIGLIIKESESDRALSFEDTSDLLRNSHLLAVIGPLLSNHLPGMAELAERAHTPLITPTATVPNVRRLGSYIFSTALTSQLQAKRIAAYAMNTQGYRRFCVLYPDTSYGRELALLFTQEVRHHEGEIIAMEIYKEGELDVTAQLKRMKVEDLKKYGVSVSVDPTKQSGKLTRMNKKVLYTPGFDAVFIPGRAADAALITAQLSFHDMKVPFLSANGWNTLDFASSADSAMDGAIFVDGFFIDSPTPTVRNFVARYKKKFQSNPTLFAMQGYDAAKLVLDTARNGATSGKAVRDQLLSQTNLLTVAGPAAFNSDGVLNRPLFLMQIKRGRLLQIN